MPTGPTRRDVLIGSAAAVGAAIVGRAQASSLLNSAASPAAASFAKSAGIRFAVVGIGGKGTSDAEDAARFGEIVAIAEIDAQTRAKSLIQYPRAASFSDFRRMFDAMHSRIDAVVVSTPDHTHAPAAAAAMRLGKHVFCQKPLTRTLHEARTLAQLARRHRVATQMGNQLTALPELRRAAAAIRSGAFGAVKEVHCWTDRAGNWWPQGVPRPQPRRTPSLVDWDAWLGPAPDRPYADGYHPFAWRGWWDFGTGALGDIGCHCMNLPFMALDLRDPVAVSAETSGHNGDSFPLWSIVRYEFPARRGRPAVTLTWYDGGKRPPQELVPGSEYGGNGTIFVCERATLYSPNEYGGGTQIVGGAPMPDVPFDQSPGHFEEWVQAIQGGKPARSNIPDYAGPLTETVLLGNLAVWANGERVEWDSRRLRVRGSGGREFERLIRPEYRKGWEL